MLMRPNKSETAVHDCHCQGGMAVCMRKVLVRPWTGFLVCQLLLLLFLKRVACLVRGNKADYYMEILTRQLQDRVQLKAKIYNREQLFRPGWVSWCCSLTNRFHVGVRHSRQHGTDLFVLNNKETTI